MEQKRLYELVFGMFVALAGCSRQAPPATPPSARPAESATTSHQAPPAAPDGTDGASASNPTLPSPPANGEAQPAPSHAMAPAGATSTAPAADEVITIDDYRADGSLRMRRQIRIGPGGQKIPHGVTTEWSEKGAPWKETHYVDGEKHGTFTEWYDNGQVGQKGEFMHGRMVGTWTWWYRNGRKEKEGTFDDNRLRHGTWSFWDQNGNKLRDEIYEHGELKRIIAP